jgi:hypothetical protein
VSAAPAVAAWSRRVRRVGGLIQLGFAAFWLIRGSLVLDGRIGPALAAGFGVIAVAAAVYGVRATTGVAGRPTGPGAGRIERAVTVATVVQLVASFAAPAAVLAAGRPDWVLPSIAVTIGPLLLWLDHRVGVPRYRLAGWALVAGPVVLVAVLSGTALVATTGIATGLLLLATATAGFRDLAVSGSCARGSRVPPARRRTPGSAPAQSSPGADFPGAPSRIVTPAGVTTWPDLLGSPVEEDTRGRGRPVRDGRADAGGGARPDRPAEPRTVIGPVADRPGWDTSRHCPSGRTASPPTTSASPNASAATRPKRPTPCRPSSRRPAPPPGLPLPAST